MDEVTQDNTAKMVNFLIQNHEFIKKDLLLPLKQQREKALANEDSVFIKEIEDQYKDRAKWIIITNICLNMRFAVDEVAVFVDNINIPELLK